MSGIWPALSYGQWSATCDTLHAHTQTLTLRAPKAGESRAIAGNPIRAKPLCRLVLTARQCPTPASDETPGPAGTAAARRSCGGCSSQKPAARSQQRRGLIRAGLRQHDRPRSRMSRCFTQQPGRGAVAAYHSPRRFASACARRSAAERRKVSTAWRCQAGSSGFSFLASSSETGSCVKTSGGSRRSMSAAHFSNCAASVSIR